MIKFGGINEASFSLISFGAMGDGTSTVLKVNLSKPPFNINYNGVVPDEFHADMGDDNTAVITAVPDQATGDVIMTIVFGTPLSSDPTVVQNVPVVPLFYSLK